MFSRRSHGTYETQLIPGRGLELPMSSRTAPPGGWRSLIQIAPLSHITVAARPFNCEDRAFPVGSRTNDRRDAAYFFVHM